MEDILIVSNYYPPEKGAAANRIEQLALHLQKHKYKVSVVCPLANYPKGKIFENYRGNFTIKENLRGIIVRRLWIFPSVSKNFLVRIMSILSFSTGLFFYLLCAKTPKKVVVQSPPLLLSFISVFVLSLKGKKIILNVSDLWPTAAIELGAMKEGSISHKASLFLERFIYKKAAVIMGQSAEILEHIRLKFPDQKCYLYRNYPDHQTNFKPAESNERIKLFYAGLLGVAQGVLEVCNKIDLNGLGVELHVFGDGAEKIEIENYLLANPEKNITFHGMLERQQLILALESFDIAIVPLKTRIFGLVPSKIFEYTALGIPILYFGGGEGETIVRENKLGWVADVENYGELNAVLKEISAMNRSALSEIKQHVFNHSQKHFNLDAQMRHLIAQGVF